MRSPFYDLEAFPLRSVSKVFSAQSSPHSFMLFMVVRDWGGRSPLYSLEVFPLRSVGRVSSARSSLLGFMLLMVVRDWGGAAPFVTSRFFHSVLSVRYLPRGVLRIVSCCSWSCEIGGRLSPFYYREVFPLRSVGKVFPAQSSPLGFPLPKLLRDWWRALDRFSFRVGCALACFAESFTLLLLGFYFAVIIHYIYGRPSGGRFCL